MSAFRIYSAKKRLVPTISAKIYLKDPLVAATNPHVGIEQIEIKGEACVGSGPTSSRIAVVDYDGDLDTLFRAAELNSTGKEFKIGHQRPTENFRFHQVHVWAVIHRTLELLEASDVFGRQIPWAFPGGRLLVFPHAGYSENAYYDRDTGALHFFYFEAQSTGKTVYTCLSHDIVSHELGHAVLDGLKPYYNEVTSAETAGFHEYFGDAIALTAALEHREIAVEVAGRGDGNLKTATVIKNIGAEFGQGLKPEYGSLADAYLRNAANNLTMKSLKGELEEHDLSNVPTGAYYDLLRRVYDRLIRQKDSTKANDRVAALMSAAAVTRRMMLRAIDYCPPVDLQFDDYAAAVIRADRAAYPVDSSGYRGLATAVFQRRGLGKGLDNPRAELPIQNNDLRTLDIEQIASSTTDAYRFLDRNREVFQIPLEANFNVINLYRTRKTGANDYRVPQEIILEFVWQEEMELKGKRFGPLNGTAFPVWCGGTAVFSRDGNLLHYIVKLNEPARQRKLAKYVAYLVASGDLTADTDEFGIGSRAGRGRRIMASVRGRRASLSRSSAARHARRVSGGSEGGH